MYDTNCTICDKTFSVTAGDELHIDGKLACPCCFVTDDVIKEMKRKASQKKNSLMLILEEEKQIEIGLAKINFLNSTYLQTLVMEDRKGSLDFNKFGDYAFDLEKEVRRLRDIYEHGIYAMPYDKQYDTDVEKKAFAGLRLINAMEFILEDAESE